MRRSLRRRVRQAPHKAASGPENLTYAELQRRAAARGYGRVVGARRDALVSFLA